MFEGNKNKILLLNSLLIVYVIIFQTVILSKFLKVNDLISASFMVIVTALAIGLFGFKRNSKSYLKDNIFFKTCILVILFFIVTYLVGYFTGFNHNAYSRKPLMILNNTFAPLVLIICMEIYRYVLVNSVNKKSKLIHVTTFALTIFEILVSINITSMAKIVMAFRITTTKIIPIITKNLLMTNLCLHEGYRSTLLYRIVMDTYIFLVPIVPDFSDYIVSCLGISFPILVYIYTISDIVEVKGKYKVQSFKDDFSIFDSIVLTCIICLVMLLSGLFPLVIIGVGSHSMNPEIHKGDAVIYKKVHKDSDIKEGDVLVFDVDGTLIVHRLIEKREENGTIYYVTKGDNNNASDDVSITIDDVKGIVSFKIRYIAYPSVYFSELVN